MTRMAEALPCRVQCSRRVLVVEKHKQNLNDKAGCVSTVYANPKGERQTYIGKVYKPL